MPQLCVVGVFVFPKISVDASVWFSIAYNVVLDLSATVTNHSWLLSQG